MNYMKWVDHNITHKDWMQSDPDDIGNPFFKGTDVRVLVIVTEFNMGKTPDDVLEDYPNLNTTHIKGIWTVIAPPVDKEWIIRRRDEIERSVLTNEQRSAYEINLLDLACEIQQWEKRQEFIQKKKLERTAKALETQDLSTA